MATTKKEMFASILAVPAVAENAEMVEFINHEIELLSRRKSTTSSKKSAEAKGRETAILEALAVIGEPVTVTEFLERAEGEVATYSNQRVSAILSKLVHAELVTKTMEKKKAYFAIKEGE